VNPGDDIILGPGERMIWTGRPRRLRSFLGPIDLFIVAFAVFAAVFFVTAVTARPPAPGPSDPSTPLVVGLFPLVFFGVFFIGPRLLAIWRDLAGTSYAVTDRRVVIRHRRREIELDLANLPYLELERSWLSGATIYFAQRQMYEGWSGFYGGSATPALRGLPDADHVYRLVSDARARARAR